MILYTEPKCPYCHRVRLVLAEKGITCDLVDVDLSSVPDELMDFNPYGTVPTLVDRELRLYESRIIMEYLDERFPHPPLLPVDPVSRAGSRLYMYRLDRDWYTLAGQIKKGSDADALRARKELREGLLTTAPVFSAKPFFMSDEFSLVDCTSPHCCGGCQPSVWNCPPRRGPSTTTRRGSSSGRPFAPASPRTSGTCVSPPEPRWPPWHL